MFTGLCLQRSNFLSILTKSWTYSSWEISFGKLMIYRNGRLYKVVDLESDLYTSNITTKIYKKYGMIHKFKIIRYNNPDDEDYDNISTVIYLASYDKDELIKLRELLDFYINF